MVDINISIPPTSTWVVFSQSPTFSILLKLVTTMENANINTNSQTDSQQSDRYTYVNHFQPCECRVRRRIFSYRLLFSMGSRLEKVGRQCHTCATNIKHWWKTPTISRTLTKTSSSERRKQPRRLETIGYASSNLMSWLKGRLHPLKTIQSPRCRDERRTQAP